MEDIALNMRAPYFYPTSTQLPASCTMKQEDGKITLPSSLLTSEGSCAYGSPGSGGVVVGGLRLCVPCS